MSSLDYVNDNASVLTIAIWELWPPIVDCWICGGPSLRKGIPVANGEPVPNDYVGEWGGVPACDTCFALHEAGDMPALAARRR